ncbi:GGDEF domain-containing protein [Mesobacillus zeae]|uniref:GGDEF domain-containing protein n=1 Tax=Mesobacillus zeae TaxID=1917180 RepID=A0A398B411_9BACI|nr:GGDEF domain-containing protein [Mesobacillus zeae]RID82463.1 GGDEF domain-containing protein [Mesobacillus zeae]
MAESVLANLGILLLMHLLINTGYLFHQAKRISGSWLCLIHVLVVVGASVSMVYFPVRFNGSEFDLSLAPLIFLSLFHGLKFSVPALFLFFLLLQLCGEDFEYGRFFFHTVLPVLLPLAFYPLDKDRIHYAKAFLIVTASWILANLPQTLEDLSALEGSLLVRYGSFMLASLILYLFITSGRRQLSLMNQLQYYAERDALTGLYNMRSFGEMLSGFKHDEKKMFIAMADIDSFKKINDTYGHQAGDEAIKKVGEIILAERSAPIVAARYGGDEFLILLAADDEKEAMSVLENIRKIASSTSFLYDGTQPDSTLSLSIGAAELTNPDCLEQVIGQADQQLYLAKRKSRNCVCINVAQ